MKTKKIKIIEDLKQFLKEFFKDEDVKIFLFGSRAEGKKYTTFRYRSGI